MLGSITRPAKTRARTQCLPSGIVAGLSSFAAEPHVWVVGGGDQEGEQGQDITGDSLLSASGWQPAPLAWRVGGGGGLALAGSVSDIWGHMGRMG